MINSVRGCIALDGWGYCVLQGRRAKCFQFFFSDMQSSENVSLISQSFFLLLWVPPTAMASTWADQFRMRSAAGWPPRSLTVFFRPPEVGPYQPLMQLMNVDLLLQAWYKDDWVLAGICPAALGAVELIEELGPALGIHINFSKCELFSRTAIHPFPFR